MATDKIFIRRDLNVGRCINDDVWSVCRDLNTNALPVFDKFLLCVSLDNLNKYCISGGKQLLIQEMSTPGKTVDPHRIWAVQTLNEYKNFPQYSITDKKYSLFSLIKVDQITQSKIVVKGANGYAELEPVVRLGFVPDYDKIEEASGIYLDNKYNSDYKKLSNLCSELMEFFKIPNQKVSEFFPQCFFVDENGISLNTDLIDDSFFKRLEEARKN